MRVHQTLTPVWSGTTVDGRERPRIEVELPRFPLTDPARLGRRHWKWSARSGISPDQLPHPTGVERGNSGGEMNALVHRELELGLGPFVQLA